MSSNASLESSGTSVAPSEVPSEPAVPLVPENGSSTTRLKNPTVLFLRGAQAAGSGSDFSTSGSPGLSTTPTATNLTRAGNPRSWTVRIGKIDPTSHVEFNASQDTPELLAEQERADGILREAVARHAGVSQIVAERLRVLEAEDRQRKEDEAGKSMLSTTFLERKKNVEISRLKLSLQKSEAHAADLQVENSSLRDELHVMRTLQTTLHDCHDGDSEDTASAAAPDLQLAVANLQRAVKTKEILCTTVSNELMSVRKELVAATAKRDELSDALEEMRENLEKTETKRTGLTRQMYVVALDGSEPHSPKEMRETVEGLEAERADLMQQVSHFAAINKDLEAQLADQIALRLDGKAVSPKDSSVQLGDEKIALRLDGRTVTRKDLVTINRQWEASYKKLKKEYAKLKLRTADSEGNPQSRRKPSRAKNAASPEDNATAASAKNSKLFSTVDETSQLSAALDGRKMPGEKRMKKKARKSAEAEDAPSRAAASRAGGGGGAAAAAAAAAAACGDCRDMPVRGDMLCPGLGEASPLHERLRLLKKSLTSAQEEVEAARQQISRLNESLHDCRSQLAAEKENHELTMAEKESLVEAFGARHDQEYNFDKLSLELGRLRTDIAVSMQSEGMLKGEVMELRKSGQRDALRLEEALKEILRLSSEKAKLERDIHEVMSSCSCDNSCLDLMTRRGLRRNLDQ